MELLINCKTPPSLSETEKVLLRSEFDSLAKTFSESDLEKGRNVFPGAGDIIQKPDDPYGDYLIYHEILKLMIVNNTNVIFLTFDNTKGDWMKKDKLPHLSFVENAFRNSQRAFYILDAERTLEDILNVNIDSLIGVEKDEITLEKLQQFLNTSSIFKGLEPYVIRNKHIVNELTMNGYNSMSQLIRDCEKANDRVQSYLSNEPNSLNRVGVLRACMRMLKSNYPYISTDGTMKVTTGMTDSTFDKYRNRV